MIGEKTKVKINLVAFILLAFGLTFAMATQVLSVLEKRYTVDAIFPDAGGVFTNQEVTYRGVTVGQVGNMEVVEDGVKISLLIREEFKIPKEEVIARVMFKSAVGEQFVDLLPGADGEPYLADGDEIPIDQTEIPVSTQELLTTLEAVLRGVPPEDLKGAVDALGIGLTGRGPDLATIIESSAELAELFADRAPEIENILKSGTQVGSAYLNSKEDFEEAVRQLVAVSEALSDNRGNLQDLLDNTNFASDEVVTFLRENRPALDEVLIDLAEINQLQADHEGDLRQLLGNLPYGLGKVVSAFEPQTGLVRFGLVQDTANPGCSYGTPRQPPSDRDTGLPPKNGNCNSTPNAATNDSSTGTSAVDPTLGGVPAATDPAFAEPSLPARMSDWSWSLFYLNGL